jgi:2-[(L-alanin-3-ylcarbamoyl)methyl]-2-hydroxybutanedioate decarboxylase
MIPPIPQRVRDALHAAGVPVCAYVYDTAVLRANAAAVVAALPGASVLYAMKANGHDAVAGTLAPSLAGLEVASGGELALALDAIGGNGGRIVFGGPGKSDAELAAAVTAARAGTDLTVNVESVHELRRLDLIAAGADRRIAVALRVNRPAAGVDGGSHRMTGVPTQFGIDEAQLDDVAAIARAMPTIDVTGFSLHAVSNNLDAAAHAAFIADAIAWSRRTAARLGIDLRDVNAGGGFGVDYTGGATFDLSALTGVVPADLRLTVEPGRFLAASAGWYAAEVLDLKQTHGRRYAILRGGTHHFRLPAAWGYSHPFTVLARDSWRYPSLPRPEFAGTAVDVVGELCTPRDVLARDAHVERIRAGDVLVFPNAGSYGWDISHHEFLRHPYPEMHVI